MTSSYTLLQMFYLLKHLLLLYLVISKQSCNNLIYTLIMSLYPLYVCLHVLTSSRIPQLILWRQTPHFRWFHHSRQGRQQPLQMNTGALIINFHPLVKSMNLHWAVKFEPINTNDEIIIRKWNNLQISDEVITLDRPLGTRQLRCTLKNLSISNLHHD
jgi:hypothetical protein